MQSGAQYTTFNDLIYNLTFSHHWCDLKTQQSMRSQWNGQHTAHKEYITDFVGLDYNEICIYLPQTQYYIFYYAFHPCSCKQSTPSASWNIQVSYSCAIQPIQMAWWQEFYTCINIGLQTACVWSTIWLRTIKYLHHSSRSKVQSHDTVHGRQCKLWTVATPTRCQLQEKHHSVADITWLNSHVPHFLQEVLHVTSVTQVWLSSHDSTGSGAACFAKNKFHTCQLHGRCLQWWQFFLSNKGASASCSTHAIRYCNENKQTNVQENMNCMFFK